MTRQKTSTFEARFGQLLDMLPISDAEVAQKLNVSKQTVSAWRTGVRSPKTPTILHISATFDVSEAWLMGFDVPMSRDATPSRVLSLSNAEIELLEIYQHLNNIGKKWLLENARLVRDNPKFQK